MSRLPDLASGFKALREIDLNAIRNQAEASFHLAIIGDNGVGKSTLINHLLFGPRSGRSLRITSVSEQQLNQELFIQPYSVVILMIDASQPDHSDERQVFERILLYRVPIIVCYNKADLIEKTQIILNEALRWPGSEVIAISAINRDTLRQKLVPALIRVYKGREILLARNLPMLREPISQKLIDNTCFINAAYCLTTGLAEMNILLDLPLNVADTIVLTKNQALMAYKIALAFDLPPDWHETIPKLATVIGSAFLWRLIARQLVGLIPVVGIIPKVAVSYAGTSAVGEGIYQWCAKDEKVNPKLLRAAFNRALKRGREVTQTLMARRKAGLVEAGDPANTGIE